MDKLDLVLSILDTTNWVDVADVDLEDKFDVENNHVKRQAFSALSFEARYMIGLVITNPKFIQFRNSERVSLTRLNTFLRKMGWRWAQIQQARCEIKDYVEEYLC
jgi:hypothetical protein